jgi:hypothetical protein
VPRPGLGIEGQCGILPIRSAVKLPPTNPHVSFARRYSSASLSTLDAYTALFRIQSLLDDIKELGALIDRAKAAGESKGRQWYWFEIISYYPVGLVTCLEWHARSRLIDMFSFSPSSIRADDLKGQINDKVLCQMVAEGITVPQLLGAMTTVGSSQKYITVFERIFEALNINVSPRTVLNPIILSSATAGGDALQQLFEYRNRVVHEIDFSQVGPWVVRDSLDLDAAQRDGQLVQNIVKAIEKAITDHAPIDFPNQLDTNGAPQDQLAKPEDRISTIESEIAEQLREFRNSDASSSVNVDDWLAAVAAWRNAVTWESAFITDADFINCRHYNFKRPILLALRRLRLEYLHIVRAEL